ncbi:MAG: molybdopterin-dependent oxidoreductase [Actinomycetota bacterium]|nr:molybdopterin-dependent oxidoreductase [Actinomycetota bacterium]
MNKKLFYISITLVIIALVAFLSYFIAINQRQKNQQELAGFNPQDIDISQIETDIQFAQAIPDYKLLFNGLLKDEKELTFSQVIENYGHLTETRTIHGVRSDGEEVDIEYTGIDLKHIMADLNLLDQAQNITVYAADLYAANFSADDLYKGIYLVWKREGEYMVPSQDGVLKIVQDNGPTYKWVKNPVLFNFISELRELADIKEGLDEEMMEFTSQQSMFVLAIGPIPQVDQQDWTLQIEGMAANSMTLDYQQLINMPQESVYTTLETISNPQGGSLIGNAIWTGVPFSHIMDMAGYSDQAVEVVFYCLDGYSTSITIEEARQPGVMLAYHMNGRQLGAEHGFPVRMVVPSKYGMKWAKWINRIEFVDYDYKGYWESRGWSDYAGRDQPQQRFE